MKRVLFGITSLGLGGAERVLVDLANRISDNYDVTIFTLYAQGELEKELKSNIKIINLYDKKQSEYNKFQKMNISFKLLFSSKPPAGFDTYIAFLEGPITRLFSKIKNEKIAWIHNDISKVFGRGFKSRIKKHFDKKIYKKYDKLVFVSSENKEDFEGIYGKQKNAKIIRNYIDYKKVLEKSKLDESIPFKSNEINIISVCRLVEQKAIDRFIEIHKKLEDNGIHSKVYIIGDGPLRYKLQKLIDALGETENFYLLGARSNPYPYIKKADYFCLLSYYEGFGMSIEEAKILDKYVIITDTAAREAVEGYEKASIFPNTKEGIYNGLKEILLKSINEEDEQDYTKIENYYNKIISEIKQII